MYTVEWHDSCHNKYVANNYEDAIMLAKKQQKKVKIINEQNGIEVWKTNDSPVLKSYLEITPETWSTLERRNDRKSDKSSVYFDIDGTLGRWNRVCKELPIEEIMNPVNHYFRDIEPHPTMIALASELTKRGVDVCIISVASKELIRDKWEWIEKNLSFLPKENIFFAPIGAKKSEFVKGNAAKSILIDDYNKNLDEWEGSAVKAINNINSRQFFYPEIDIIQMYENRKRILIEMEQDSYIDKKEVNQYKEATIAIGEGLVMHATEKIENILSLIQELEESNQTKIQDIVLSIPFSVQDTKTKKLIQRGNYKDAVV